MIGFESPKATLFDGTLLAWGSFVVIHGVEAITAVLTLAVLTVRLMILVRQWRRG